MPFTITFRRASILDANDLFRWKNDPIVRQFSIETKDEIKFDRHMTWMDWALTNSQVRIYIIEADGTPCGDVRFEIHARYIEIAIKLDSRFRGSGIGAFALKEIGDLVQTEFQRPLIAKIVYGNVASMRLFEGCGYRIIGSGEGYYVCSKVYTPTLK